MKMIVKVNVEGTSWSWTRSRAESGSWSRRSMDWFGSLIWSMSWSRSWSWTRDWARPWAVSGF